MREERNSTIPSGGLRVGCRHFRPIRHPGHMVRTSSPTASRMPSPNDVFGPICQPAWTLPTRCNQGSNKARQSSDTLPFGSFGCRMFSLVIPCSGTLLPQFFLNRLVSPRLRVFPTWVKASKVTVRHPGFQLHLGKAGVAQTNATPRDGRFIMEVAICG